MVDVLILNGPNLNMLGVREPAIYGHGTLSDLNRLCHDTAQTLGLSVECRQSNDEGQLVTWIQEARGNIRGLIINAAAYTHTSIAIHDALKLLDGVPVIEVHLSDPEKREAFRHISYITPLASRVIKGQGDQGYVLALHELSGLFAGSKA
ncbi:MAG: type II 3-dehydroquinate dehydratase [Micavibrio sp.]